MGSSLKNPVKNEVKTGNIKSEENVNTNQDSRSDEDAQKTIKSISFTKQKNQVKQDHHEDKDKNFILALKRLHMLYNPGSLHYIKNKFNYMMLEDTSEEKGIYIPRTHLLQCDVIRIRRTT